jgi:hypothetical protein
MPIMPPPITATSNFVEFMVNVFEPIVVIYSVHVFFQEN